MMKYENIIKVFFIATNSDKKIIFGKQCHIKGPFSTHPANSNFLSIYEIVIRSGCLEVFSCGHIAYKGVVLPYNNNHVFFH